MDGVGCISMSNACLGSPGVSGVVRVWQQHRGSSSPVGRSRFLLAADPRLCFCWQRWTERILRVSPHPLLLRQRKPILGLKGSMTHGVHHVGSTCGAQGRPGALLGT